MQLLFEQPDLSTRKGVRDLALLALMYDTGARVQEIIDTTPSSLRLDKPYTRQRNKGQDRSTYGRTDSPLKVLHRQK